MCTKILGEIKEDLNKSQIQYFSWIKSLNNVNADSLQIDLHIQSTSNEISLFFP